MDPLKILLLAFFFLKLFRKLVTVFDSQKSKKTQISVKNMLHPVKVAFLRPKKIVILGK